MKYTIIVLCLLSMLSCQKELEVDDVIMNVSLNKDSIFLMDTTMFSFSGNPDMITFWSGEVGKRYEYRGRTEAEGTPIMSFRTKKFHTQDNTLNLLISTNFAGLTSVDSINKANISSATWRDISDKAILPTGTNLTLTNSGNIDLSIYKDSLIYFAFKYTGLKGVPFQRWEIDSYTIKNNLADGTSYTIANFNSYNSSFTNYGVTTFCPGFTFMTPNNTPIWFNSTVNSVAGIVFKTDNAGLTTDCDAWAIIGPINLKKVTPDVGTVIKSISQITKDLKFNYIYPSKGRFNATIVGGNTSINFQKLVNKKFIITVQ